MGPISHSDGLDDVWKRGEFVPRLAGGVDDVVVGPEHPVGEPVLAQILPDVLDRVEFRRARGQPDRRDVFGHPQFGRGVPTGGSKISAACAPGATWTAISSRGSCIIWVSAHGSAKAAPLPWAGQIAPNR